MERLARKALTIIKLRYGLPKSGFLTGGAIANLVWELKSGNKAVINDIDIFLHREPTPDVNSLFKYEKIELQHLEPYKHIKIGNSENTYNIKGSENNGLFNEVIYESTNKSPKLIIDSFDINCTKIGYSIDEDKFYWSEDFEEFINTGELKISNLNTPAHTAIRMVKKKVELNATLKDFEISICQYVLANPRYFVDTSRVRFKDRYAEMYEKNSEYLNQFFTMERDSSLETYLTLEKNVSDRVFFLKASEKNSDIFFNDVNLYAPGFNARVTNSEEFLFYIRNIYKSIEKQILWNKLSFFYHSHDYISDDANVDDINFLHKLTMSNPNVIRNIQGMKFQEQIDIIKNVLDKITLYHDVETAMAVLEHVDLTKGLILDDDECLLIGLSVRKKVVRPTDILPL